MNRIFYQQDCDLQKLAGKTVAIIGYGSQGHAHALNLKESGVNVIVGLYTGSKSWAKAEAQGMTVMTADEATKLYDDITTEARELMLRKNHDYGEAWRDMLPSSLTDIILTKINRNKQINANDGRTLISEGADGNYFDMLNYAVFYLIKYMEADK